MPHTHTYTRLGVSKIHGIGVICVRPIPKGTNIFSDDMINVRWLPADSLDSIADPSMRRLYTDFCVRKGDQLACPPNFNTITVGWYINEPAPGSEANVTADEEYNFIAARDISPGEELTVQYATFSDPMNRY